MFSLIHLENLCFNRKYTCVLIESIGSFSERELSKSRIVKVLHMDVS